jgi:hypothetical protein
MTDHTIAPLECPHCGKPNVLPLTHTRLRERVLEVAAKIAPTLPDDHVVAAIGSEQAALRADAAAGRSARNYVGWLLEALDGICYDCSPTTARLKSIEDSLPALADAAHAELARALSNRPYPR